MNNNVEIWPDDLRKLVEAGHAELTQPPWVRRRNGKLVLAVLDGRCPQLRKDGLCAIYDARPSACADFPMGSEGCLFARDEELGIFDGARDTIAP